MMDDEENIDPLESNIQNQSHQQQLVARQQQSCKEEEDEEEEATTTTAETSDKLEKVVDEDEFVVGSGGDYYTLLGVSREADETEIKNAYRKLARENHPDKNLDDDESVNRFKQIGFAYSVLSDPIKRRQYNLLFVGNVGKKCKTALNTMQNFYKQKATEFSQLDEETRKFRKARGFAPFVSPVSSSLSSSRIVHTINNIKALMPNSKECKKCKEKDELIAKLQYRNDCLQQTIRNSYKRKAPMEEVGAVDVDRIAKTKRHHSQ